MNTLQQDLQRLEDKLQQLIQLQQNLHTENEKLQAALHKAEAEKTEWQQKAENAEQQLNVLRLNQENLNEADRKEMEKKINQYIREIDRCITQLGE
jgi:regulator of replication initiation timing